MKVQAASSVTQLLYRRRDTAKALAISESLVLIYERRGWLPVVRLPKVKGNEGKRVDGGVRHAVEDVEALARRIRSGELLATMSSQMSDSAVRA